jgi:serine protease AprX
VNCKSCGAEVAEDILSQARLYPFWVDKHGACPACVQQNLLRCLLAQGDGAFHRGIQTAWPLDARAAFGALPTRLRLHADPRFSGRGVTLAIIDAGFYPHADLILPDNRIRAWVDATQYPPLVLRFSSKQEPRWPAWNAADPWQWHGLMTSAVAAGNGFLSHGLYSSLAYNSDVVLIQVRDSHGDISNASIARGLIWIGKHASEFRIRIASASVGGDAVSELTLNAVDREVDALVESGITVVVAAGNDGERHLLPPATAPSSITVGGIDDKNLFVTDEVTLWHGNYGSAINGVPKPELVAPSIWVVAPLLTDSLEARSAERLFQDDRRDDPQWRRQVEELKLVTPYYQHVEGTSFSTPIVASAIACMLEANPDLSPALVRDLLMETAQFVPGASRERQGAGAVAPGMAVSRAMAEKHSRTVNWKSPQSRSQGILFCLHDHSAFIVEVLGSWNNWKSPGVPARMIEPGVWQTPAIHLPSGKHNYKFLIDNKHWLDDPANPSKSPDNFGGFNSLLLVSYDHRMSHPQQ